MKDPLALFPGYSLRRAATAASSELAQRLAHLRLRQADVSLMMLIQTNPGITGSALGRHLDIQRANMVPILKRLEDAGLIDRAPINRKSQGLALTSAGQDRLAEAREVVEQFEADLLARIPEEHRAHLLPALDALWR